jgi:hypothetical protein
MNDEKYLFISDSRDKKNVARSARNKRSHCGRGGRVRLPSDYMTKKELNAMNGECKTYRLNEPMSWAEFSAMPDEHKITYIKLIRNKWNAPGSYISKMMGTNPCSYSNEVNRLGLGEGKGSRGKDTKWDKDGFLMWATGVPTEKVALPVAEEDETPVVEEVVEEFEGAAEEVKTLHIPPVAPYASCVPKSGTLSFEGNIDEVANTIRVLLCGEKVKLSVRWEVIDNG